MADMLRKGAVWLESARRRFLSHTVSYKRTSADGVNVTTADLPATTGETRFEAIDSNNIAITFASRDFLIHRTDFEAYNFGTPQRGDRVSDEIDGVLCVFEVMAPPGQECWRWSDPERQTIRVHTKAVDRNA